MAKETKYIVTYHGEVVSKTKNEQDAVDTAKFYAYANKIDYSIIIKNSIIGKKSTTLNGSTTICFTSIVWVK